MAAAFAVGLAFLDPALAGPAGFLPTGDMGPTPPWAQPLFVAEALGVLAAIVAVHEAGHFTAARVQGIHVTKFAIGFGPPLVKFERGGVEYSLRAVPLGGYVAFPDDDPDSKYAKDDPDLLRNRSVPERAAVISAGVIANIVFAYAVLLLQVGTVGKAETTFDAGVVIPKVTPASAAARAGFRDGDVILGVGDYRVGAAASQVGKVVGLIKDAPGTKLAFEVARQGAPSPFIVECVPDVTGDGRGRIGVQLVPNARIQHTKAGSPGELVAIANAEFGRLAGTVTDGLRRIVTNFTGVAGQISGPVAIVAAGSEIAKTDSAGMFQFCAIVNINLAVVNMLPLPALDGGYLALLALEAVRGGQKLPEKFEQGVMASGLLLLMAMGFGLVIKDTLSLLPPLPGL